MKSDRIRRRLTMQQEAVRDVSDIRCGLINEDDKDVLLVAQTKTLISIGEALCDLMDMIEEDRK